MDYSQLITIEPGKRSEQPCIGGMRITVQDVLEYLASGMTPDEVLADFPDLTAEDIRPCLAFAADRERRLRVGNGATTAIAALLRNRLADILAFEADPAAAVLALA